MAQTSSTIYMTRGEWFLEDLGTAFVAVAFFFAYGLCGLAICIEGLKVTFGFSQQGLYMTMALWSVYAAFLLVFVGRVNPLSSTDRKRPFRYVCKWL